MISVNKVGLKLGAHFSAKLGRQGERTSGSETTDVGIGLNQLGRTARRGLGWGGQRQSSRT
jgi:hypothetical protein